MPIVEMRSALGFATCDSPNNSDERDQRGPAAREHLDPAEENGAEDYLLGNGREDRSSDDGGQQVARVAGAQDAVNSRQRSSPDDCGEHRAADCQPKE